MALLVFDVETDGFLRQASAVLCIGIGDYEADTVDMYHGDRLPEALERLLEADKLIGHNILGFDLLVLEKLYSALGLHFDRRRCWDTLVMSRLYFVERTRAHSGHGLDAWGKSLGLPKLPQPAFTSCTPELLTYCERDVRLNMRVLTAILERVAANEAQGYVS